MEKAQYADHTKGFDGEDLVTPEQITAHNTAVNLLVAQARTYEGYLVQMSRHTGVQIGAASPLERMEWVAWCKERDREAGLL